jgi:hypothetical protein
LPRTGKLPPPFLSLALRLGRVCWGVSSHEVVMPFGSMLQNAIEEARGLSRNRADHGRARLESRTGETLDEVDKQIEQLRTAKG